MAKRATAGLLCLIATSCSGGHPPPGPLPPPLSAAPVPLRATPAWVRDLCATVAVVRPICPAALPRGAGSGLDASIASGRGAKVFTAAFGGEQMGDPARNRPPRFFSVVVAAGDLARAARAAWPRAHAPAVAVRDDLMRRRTRSALDLGTRRWSGVTGTLVLAPERPYTAFSDDLVFRWGGGHRAIALSAWQPLHETVQTLRVLLGRTLRTAAPLPPHPERRLRGVLPHGLVAVPTPRWMREACAALPRVGGHCPGLIPLARSPLLQVSVAPGVRLTGGEREDLLSAEWGGESTAHPSQNRPPGFLHMEVSAGHVGAFRPFLRGVSSPRNGLMRGRSFLAAAPVAFGARRWGGHAGVLMLGDCYGNHLCFRWRDGAALHQLDVHGWEPFTETVATLRRIAGSTP